ncbi:bacillithiol system redox-active protein YtxJ [Aureibacillus halotolerans]|uniref:Bacillithiol system protein YtxJ n=1 Tax=Aureibacillus halotolerans TaxID=1508390 RepID=A0A4R6U3L1_9BACI|nr:bacillithiol system redox-active protein YtxJ [Aureibacillus halotolerans]TDQ39079.1 bacillithiol system protein YtxJ [Aureibacillus halotolerans]
MEHLNSIQRFEQLIEEQSPFFLLKHSLTCPISANAHNAYETFSEKTEVPCFVLYVQKDQEVSAKITESTGVTHQSPQAFLLNGSSVLWDASHQSITVQALDDAEKKVM